MAITGSQPRLTAGPGVEHFSIGGRLAMCRVTTVYMYS